MKQVSVGVDIGGTNTAIGVVDESGHVLAKDNIKTPDHGDIDQYIQDLSAAIRKLITNAKMLNENLEVLGIGIGAFLMVTTIMELSNMLQTFHLKVLFLWLNY